MSGVNAFGTQLKRGNGASPETFTALANCTGITPPGISRETIDVTAHDSSTAFMEFLGGLKDGGEFSTDVNYNPGQHDFLLADLDDTAPRNYKIVFPDQLNTTWSFTGILTGYEPDAPYDDKLSATLTWKVSGKPTFS